MKSSEPVTERIYTQPSQFTVHYRAARRTRWSSDARPHYAALFLLRGRLNWNRATGACGDTDLGYTNAGGAGCDSPGETLHAQSDAHVEYLELTLAPAIVLDCAVRARLTRADALIAFHTTSVAQDKKLAHLSRDLADELVEKAAGQELVLAALVEQALVHLLRRYANIRRSDEVELSRVGLVDRRIRRAVELMHAHLDRDLPLEEIAAAAHLSPFHFARLFKKLTGASPHAYLASLRVERAQMLLAETDLSVTEIGARVGYSSSSHFAKAFRQAAGLSPRAFRNALIPRQ